MRVISIRRTDGHAPAGVLRTIEDTYVNMGEQQLRGELAHADRIELQTHEDDGSTRHVSLFDRTLGEREAREQMPGGFCCVVLHAASEPEAHLYLALVREIKEQD